MLEGLISHTSWILEVPLELSCLELWFSPRNSVYKVATFLRSVQNPVMRLKGGTGTLQNLTSASAGVFEVNTQGSTLGGQNFTSPVHPSSWQRCPHGARKARGQDQRCHCGACSLQELQCGYGKG